MQRREITVQSVETAKASPFASSLLMRTGDLAVFFPDDAHKPGCMAGGRDAVRKVVEQGATEVAVVPLLFVPESAREGVKRYALGVFLLEALLGGGPSYWSGPPRARHFMRRLWHSAIRRRVNRLSSARNGRRIFARRFLH